MNFLKNHRKLTLLLAAVSLILIPVFLSNGVLANGTPTPGAPNEGITSGSDLRTPGLSDEPGTHQGLAYVFTKEGVEIINIQTGIVTGSFAGVPRSSWPDNWGNKDSKILWANIGSPSDGKGLFALDTVTAAVTKVFTNSTSGNWGIQSPDRRWVYGAARDPAQAYIKVGGDPAFSDFATVVASVPIPGTNVNPTKSGPGP